MLKRRRRKKTSEQRRSLDKWADGLCNFCMNFARLVAWGELMQLGLLRVSRSTMYSLELLIQVFIGCFH